jgi:hypothetical protein
MIDRSERVVIETYLRSGGGGGGGGGVAVIDAVKSITVVRTLVNTQNVPHYCAARE